MSDFVEKPVDACPPGCVTVDDLCAELERDIEVAASTKPVWGTLSVRLSIATGRALLADRKRLQAERDELKNGLWRFWNQKAREYLDRATAEHARAERLQARLAEAVEVLRPFAEAAREFTFAIGPDGIDDGVGVVATTVVGNRETTLSTAHFSHASALVSGE